MTTITLKGTADFSSRIQLLRDLHDSTAEKVNRTDSIRQNNLVLATAVFAGLMSFALTLHNWSSQCVVSAALFVLMTILCLWDRRWHKTKHGWDETRKTAYAMMAQLINSPTDDVTFPRYDSDGENDAQWGSLLPMIYYLMILGATASPLVFRLFSASQP